jgi:hypothetical protein
LEEENEKRERGSKLKEYLGVQIAEKDKKQEEEFLNERRMAARSQAVRDQNEKEYLSYAEKCMKEWADQGKNVIPLVKQLKAYKNNKF